jgi:hypothetical protein
LFFFHRKGDGRKVRARLAPGAPSMASAVAIDVDGAGCGVQGEAFLDR